MRADNMRYLAHPSPPRTLRVEQVPSACRWMSASQRGRGTLWDPTAKTRIGTAVTRIGRFHGRIPTRGAPAPRSTVPRSGCKQRIAACYCAPLRSHPVNGARRRAEEGPLCGSDPEDVQRIGDDAPMIGSTVASPKAGPLLRVAPILLRVPAHPLPGAKGRAPSSPTLHPGGEGSVKALMRTCQDGEGSIEVQMRYHAFAQG